MAKAECARIVAEAEARWPVTIALRHRHGPLEVGETAIAVGRGSGHRAAALRRAAIVVEEVKRRVPIWNRSFTPMGRSNGWILRQSVAPFRRSRHDRPIPDLFDRPLGSLRVSVTDRCNMRCRYCMPEAEYIWLPRESILTFEEIDRLVGYLYDARSVQAPADRR